MAIMDKKEFMKKISDGDLNRVNGGTEEDFWKEVDKLYAHYGVSTLDELNDLLTEEECYELLYAALKKPEENE